MNKRIFSFLVLLLMTIGLIIQCDYVKAVEKTKISTNISVNNIDKNKVNPLC